MDEHAPAAHRAAQASNRGAVHLARQALHGVRAQELQGTDPNLRHKPAGRAHEHL